MSTDAYLRYPTIADDRIVVVAEDDLWLVPATGGRAHRLTADADQPRSPRLSPDGAQVAWTVLRDGASEVYVKDVDGGPARRLTYWGQDRTHVRGWLSPTEVLVVSTVGEAERSRCFAHAVPVDGTPSRRLPYGWVADLAIAAKGALLSTTTTVEPAYWKRYRGGTAAQLWFDGRVEPGADGRFDRIFRELESSLVCPLLVADSAGKPRVGFLSDHDGVAQVYSAPVRRGKVVETELSCHSAGEHYARHASSDGRQVVYVAGGSLYLLSSLDADATPVEVDVRLAGSRAGLQPSIHDLASTIDFISPDRTGRASIVGARGSVHYLPHRQGASRVLADGSGVRRRQPMVLGETKRAVWVTDEHGDDALEILDLADVGATPRVLVRPGRLGRVVEMTASPDGSRIAIASHDGRLLTVDVPAKVSRAVSPKELDRSNNGDLGDLAWSPDSAWLAWSLPDRADSMARIRMANVGVKGAGPFDVTSTRFNDFSPTFTTDGKHLAFLSYRSFDPVYDSYVFDLSFPGGCRPYLVPLAADTPSPFDAAVDGRPLDGEEGVPGPENPDDTAKEKKDDDKTPRTRVDADGIEQRIVPFPVDAGRLSSLRAVQGGLVWVVHPTRGELGEDLTSEPPRPAVAHLDLGTGKVETILDAVDSVEVTGDGSRLVVFHDGALSVVPAGRRVEEDAAERIEVDLTRSTVTIDPVAQWRQMYAEAWRLMRDNFWRADMNGVDWPAAYEKYLPLIERLGSHDDLIDLLWELQGELGSSHAYVDPLPATASAVRRQGMLGAEIAYRDGDWVIDEIVPGESSARAARSPLMGPGVGVRPGDRIVAIAGRAVSETMSPARLLVGTAGKPTEVVVRPGARGSKPRRVVVTPLAEEFSLRYQAWVRDRRAHVHHRTGGKVGYLHVPDMVSGGWAQLHRDLRTEIGREGVIVDVRGNRGGHTSQLVIEKLARTVVGWDVSRGFEPYTYPMDARRGPMVAVTDMHAGSDGDIVTAAIRELGLGPVVGTRTWGGVVGIDGRYQLVDGTGVTQPRYAFWFERFGWSVENYGVEPDIEVEVSPQDRAAGNDVQLDRAIALIITQLAATPAKQPPPLP
ncbi:S41 family peptidase [Blastococcus sp. Marseille-P5729]|uniref:S41 family peptidase n=1 Tax=Blastococcus sp. Marseille-P5729 TaxID=2086582 RepID=UPI000D0FE025|nr:S41 family peptidase [Blastococcus sp. Marseille-P5729]